MTTHAGCRMYLPTECNFGILQPIYLPPHSVSIPRTEVPIEAIIGVQVKSKTSLVRDYSCRKYSNLFTLPPPPPYPRKNKLNLNLRRLPAQVPTTSHVHPLNQKHTHQNKLILGCISYRCCGTLKYILRPWKIISTQLKSNQINSAPTLILS